MMKPDRVAQLVDDDAEFLAVAPNRDGLSSTAILAQKGAATKVEVPWLVMSPIGFQGALDSPAALNGEVNVVGVHLWIALHKLDARVVLPVAHRLLKQRLVSAAKYGVYLIWNDAVVPCTLLAHGDAPSKPLASWQKIIRFVSPE